LRTCELLACAAVFHNMSIEDSPWAEIDCDYDPDPGLHVNDDWRSASVAEFAESAAGRHAEPATPLARQQGIAMRDSIKASMWAAHLQRHAERMDE
jgi:hypothetical protein